MPRPVQDWREKYGVVDPSVTEIIGDSLYHRRTYVSGTTTGLTFFDTVPANRREGNMKIAGQLPAGHAFLVQAIRVFLLVQPQAQEAQAAATDPYTGTLNDLFLFYTNGHFTQQVQNKGYADYPLWMLPPGAGFGHAGFSGGDSAAGVTVVQVGCWGQPDPRAVFQLAVPYAIPPQASFPTTITFPAGAITLAGGDTDVVVVLDGQLARPVQ